jgi:energy-coupling factor transporter ATP-binding protein EcfA2
MRITKIEIKDFRAFKGGPIVIDLAPGKNLLAYGENGSGKSSLFNALKFFLEREAENHDFIANQNIFVTTDDGYIKLTLDDADGDTDAGTYEWSKAVNHTGKPLILEINKTKGFIDYKDLLATYFLQQEKNAVNIFDLLINNLIPNVTNDITKNTFGSDWNDTQKSIPARNTDRQVKRVESKLAQFNSGLKNKLVELAQETQKILTAFEYDIIVDFKFDGVTYNRAKWAWEKGFVGMDVGLKVNFCGKETNNHHHFLNEAKLSAIAISIFLAALRLQPSSRLKVLALDDVLIGLDMAHRLPLLGVLSDFFKDWQVLLLTYDRAWYEITKQQVDGWAHRELFAIRIGDYEQPILREDQDHLYWALHFLQDGHVKAAAVHVRTKFELVLKWACHSLGLPVKYRQEAHKIPASDFWAALQSASIKISPAPCFHRLPDGTVKWWQPKQIEQRVVPLPLDRKIKHAISWVLNPLSHSQTVDRYSKEIDEAIFALDELEDVVKKAISFQSAGPVMLREMLLRILQQRPAPVAPLAAQTAPPTI